MLINFKELAQATAAGDPCELFPGQELAVLVDCPHIHVKVSHTLVKIPHSQVSDYVKTYIAMSHLTCLCEIFPWMCHKVTYSLRKVTELCPNDIITLIDV
jgi:hypothetical protein